jgi:hypothetical protein
MNTNNVYSSILQILGENESNLLEIVAKLGPQSHHQDIYQHVNTIQSNHQQLTEFCQDLNRSNLFFLAKIVSLNDENLAISQQLKLCAKVMLMHNVALYLISEHSCS